MEIAFSIYFGVGIFWAALFLIINTMTFFIDDEFNPILARLFFGALVWPLIVLGGLIFVIVMGARAAWPEDWADAWDDYRAKRQVKARKETDY